MSDPFMWAGGLLVLVLLIVTWVVSHADDDDWDGMA